MLEKARTLGFVALAIHAADILFLSTATPDPSGWTLVPVFLASTLALLGFVFVALGFRSGSPGRRLVLPVFLNGLALVLGGPAIAFSLSLLVAA